MAGTDITLSLPRRLSEDSARANGWRLQRIRWWNAYAVLTRLPAPHRLSPSDALALLDANFLGRTRVVALDGDGYRALLRRAGKEGIVGGRTYDAVIAQCALKAKAATLLAFNAKHFADLEAAGVRVVVPAVESRQ